MIIIKSRCLSFRVKKAKIRRITLISACLLAADVELVKEQAPLFLHSLQLDTEAHSKLLCNLIQALQPAVLITNPVRVFGGLFERFVIY